MKKTINILAVLLLTISAFAQRLDIVQAGVTYQFPASQTGEMTFTEGTQLTVMGKTFSLSNITMNVVNGDAATIDSTVYINYSGTTAKVTVPGHLAQYLMVETSGAHVSIIQSSEVGDNTCGEITYNLSGASTDGEFYLSGSYKATVELNGLELTNTSMTYSGAPIYIDNGKRIDLSVKKGTENTIKDTSASTAKGALYCKGHLELKGQGTLNVYAYGTDAHGIKTGDYCELRKCTVNILKATKDGLHANAYFLQESGVLNISGVGDDGIQVELDGTVSTGETTDHEDEDTGNFYITDGTLNITTTGTATKGIKVAAEVNIRGGELNVTTSGGTDATDTSNISGCSAIKAETALNITGGTITAKSTGQGGKAISSDGTITISGGTLTAMATGANYGSSSGGGGKGGWGGGWGGNPWGGGSSSTNHKYAKGVKADGDMVISGGTVIVSSSSHEGLETKGTLTITGGDVYVSASDDAINSASHMYLKGGHVAGISSGNDGLDANGNMYVQGANVFASCAGGPEMGLDANTEGGYKLYIQSGSVVSLGPLERGYSSSLSVKSSSSWSKNTWYTLYNNGTAVFSFKTPASGGSGIYYATSGTATVSTTSMNGTSIWNGMGIR